jgi:hypothetical protein
MNHLGTISTGVCLMLAGVLLSFVFFDLEKSKSPPQPELTLLTCDHYTVIRQLPSGDITIHIPKEKP